MTLHFRDFELDPARYQLRRAGVPLEVPRQVFDLILLLARHRDRPVPKTEILASVWRGRSVTEASLTQAITRARKLLGDSPTTQSIIKTVHGRGYWWVVETREVRASSSLAGSVVASLVGRDPEMRLISQALGDTLDSKGCMLLLIGEAGIGKTRLLDECATRGAQDGFQVLSAPCLEHEGAPPGFPWVSVLRKCIENFGQVRQAPEIVDAIGHLTEVFPEIDERQRLLDSGRLLRSSETFAVFESIWRVLSSSAKRAPQLIVIDDLHRADDLSLRILRLLARRLGEDRLMVIGCARDIGAGPLQVAASLGEIAKNHRARTISLQPLKRSAVSQFLVQAGFEPPEALCDALFDRSGGNPFFLTQLLHSLALTEGDVSSPQLDTSTLPLSLRDAILRLLQDVPEESLGILEIGAVAGRSFSPMLLADVARTSIQEAVAALEICEKLGLVEEDPHSAGGLRFRHVLVRDVVYQGLSRQARACLHRDIACVLRSAPGANDLAVAHHLQSAFPVVGAEEVAHASVTAAKQASARSAFVEAANQCRRALNLSGFEAKLSPELRCELILTEAAARLRSGQRGEGRLGLRQAATLARSAGLVAQFADTALAIAPGFFAIETGVVDPELVETLEQAVAVLPQGDSLVRVRLLGNLAAALYWCPERGRVQGLLDESLAIAERISSREAHAYALAARFVGLWSPRTLGGRLRDGARLLSLCDETGDDDLRLMSRVFLVATFLEAGQVGEARGQIKALEDIARITRHPHVQWYGPMYRAMLEISRGRFEQARPHMERFVDLGTRFDDANVVQTFLLQSAEISWQTGSSERILSAVESNVVDNPTLKEWECAFAFLLARAGRDEDARRLAGRLIVELDGDLLCRMNATIGLAALAETCWILDDADLALALDPMMATLGERVVVAGYGVLCWGSSCRGLGHVAATLGRWDEAELRYSEALRLEERLGATAWRARTSAALGRALERRGKRGDRERGERMKEYARSVAADLGLSGLDGCSG